MYAGRWSGWLFAVSLVPASWFELVIHNSTFSLMTHVPAFYGFMGESPSSFIAAPCCIENRGYLISFLSCSPVSRIPIKAPSSLPPWRETSTTLGRTLWVWCWAATTSGQSVLQQFALTAWFSIRVSPHTLCRQHLITDALWKYGECDHVYFTAPQHILGV